MIFLFIVGLIALVVSSFMIGYNMSEINWCKAMNTTLDNCDREMDSNRHTTDWYHGAIWTCRSIMENIPSLTKNKKGENYD